MTAPSIVPKPQSAWYVQAGGRVWGPYPQARLADFLDEGRLTAQSLVATQASGPFGPAQHRRELASLFAPRLAPVAAAPGQGQREPPGPRQIPATPALASSPPEPQARSEPARAMVVWTDLSSLAPHRFEAVLAAYGPYIAIRPGLWLIQARISPQALRNALSRRLRGDDILMVLQAPLEQAAWFNLDQAAERAVRQLWGGQREG